MSHNPRRKKLVDSRVQGALVRRLALQWLACLVIATLSALVLQFCANPFVSPVVHFKNMWWSHGPLLVSVLLLLPVFVMDTIKLSNRFVGPIQRIRVSMRAVAQGEPAEPVSFRAGDFWQEIAEEYNVILEKLSAAQEAAASAADEKDKVLVQS